jgi:hypothetical protein
VQEVAVEPAPVIEDPVVELTQRSRRGSIVRSIRATCAALAVGSAVPTSSASSPVTPREARQAAAEAVAAAEARRAHRAVAVGPSLGAWATEQDGPAITAGVVIAFYRVQVVPSIGLVAGLVRAAAPSRPRLDAVAERAVASLLSPAKLIASPRVIVSLDGELIGSRIWSLRTGGGFGIGILRLGVTTAFSPGSSRGLHGGGEIGVHVFSGRDPRSPVFDCFLRFEAGLAGSAESRAGVGGRLIVDVF